MKKINNAFIWRQSRCWRWQRTREHDMDGERSWRIYDKYRGHLIGLIWESEFR